MLPIVALVSGTGSNLGAIMDAIGAGRCDAELRAVISDRPSAPALARATARGVTTAVVRPRDFESREAWDHALAQELARHEPRLIVLAGFMRLVGACVLGQHPGRVINVHPALLPLFPGTHAPAAAIAAGVRVSGCTVHVVDAGMDTGPVIAQAVVPVLPEDTSESLHRRIQRAEHQLFPAVIDAVASGAIELGPPVRIDATRFAPDAMLVSPAIVPG